MEDYIKAEIEIQKKYECFRKCMSVMKNQGVNANRNKKKVDKYFAKSCRNMCKQNPDVILEYLKNINKAKKL